MSTLAVVEEILRETEVPMSVREIVERAGVRLPSRSKTPDTVVARDLAMDIKKKGEDVVVRAHVSRSLHAACAGARCGDCARLRIEARKRTSLAPAALRATAGTAPIATIPARKPAAAAAPSSATRRDVREADGGGDRARCS